MRMLLARHGNTFLPNERPVRVGRRNDLPLVQSGFEQAAAFGAWLKEQKVKPVKVYTGVLRRQLDFAKAALEVADINVPITVDDRLSEIDYGDWTDLDNGEIVERFGQEELDRWEKQGLWPHTGNWEGSAEEIKQNLRSFMTDAQRGVQPDEDVLTVSSNGILRYFLTLVPGAWDTAVREGTLKMGTGHVSQMAHRDLGWSLDFWNMNPAGKPAAPAVGMTPPMGQVEDKAKTLHRPN